MRSCRTFVWFIPCLIGAVAVLYSSADEDPKKVRYPKPPSAENVKIVPDGWKTAPRKPLDRGEIDRLLAQARKPDSPSLAPIINDEQFIRRVSLDVVGKLPTPADVELFVADKDPNKRAKVIDRLLDSEDYARFWGRYIRDVLVWRATDQRIIPRLMRTVTLEAWLVDQFKKNRSWSAISHDLITANGSLRQRHLEGGETGFMLSHTGDDAIIERAADTSRIFLGIRIQCAQCHDHPDDIWKRNQFHEFAAFLGRTGDSTIKPAAKGEGAGNIGLLSLDKGEYQMPDQDDPKKSYTVHPKFLLGDLKVPQALSDAERRKVLADSITSKENYWFAAAFVNRVWGALMSQAFNQPVDNMGPLQTPTNPEVLLRLADAFRATDHDIKGLLRAILNSEAYQRQFRLGQALEEHLGFAAMYPGRISGHALWQSLETALGPFPPEDEENVKRFKGGGNVLAGPFTQGAPALQYLVRLAFDADPSLNADEVEATITQAMMLMNNKDLNAQIKSTGDTSLAELLSSHKQDESAIQIVYLRTLGRKPTADEMDGCRDHLKTVAKRGEAFEDIVWALVNSREFQTKR